MGWRPAGGGDTFTLDSSNIGAAQWSRAAKAYELKILSRTSGVIQLDGFEQEVCYSPNFRWLLDELLTLVFLLRISND